MCLQVFENVVLRDEILVREVSVVLRRRDGMKLNLAWRCIESDVSDHMENRLCPTQDDAATCISATVTAIIVMHTYP